MNKKQIIICRVIGLTIVLLVSGCVRMPPKEASKDDSARQVRVGGDITVTTVNRNGF